MKPNVRHILVPIQRGDEGPKSVIQAIIFREKYGSQITFLYTIPKRNLYYRLIHPMDLIRKKKQAFFEVKAMLSNYYGGNIPQFVRIKIKKGNLVQVLIRIIYRGKYDLLIINKNLERRPSLRQSWESGIIRIVGEAFCPVVIFGEKISSNGVRKILVPVENNRRHRHNLLWAADLAERYHASVNLVSFLSGNITMEQSRVFRKALRIRKWFEKQQISCEISLLEIKGQARHDVLCKFIQKSQPDLVLIMTHQETLFDINHIGKLASGVIREAETPVFAITPKKETLFTALLDFMLPKKFRNNITQALSPPDHQKVKTNKG